MNRIQSLVLIGREWTDSFGNTYYTTTVVVNGVAIELNPRPRYGHGSSVHWHAAESMLRDSGYSVPSRPMLWRACQDRGISTHCEVIRVGRRKDL